MSSQWIDIGASDSVHETEPLSVEVDGIPVVVVRCGLDIYAVEDRCTHDGEALGEAEVESCQIICPRHGARFCLRTGEALTDRKSTRLNSSHLRESRMPSSA